MRRSLPIVAAVLVAPVGLAHAGSKAVDPTPQPGWETVSPTPPPPAGPPPTTTTSTTTTTVVEVPAPVPVVDDVSRARGNRLLITGGVFMGAGLVANGLRAYVASEPCQRVPQPYEPCELSWHMLTAGAWATNIVSLPLMAVGAKHRGRYDAAFDPEAHRTRRPWMIAAGAGLLGLGFFANFGLRMAWFLDYTNPGGRSAFDFAEPAQAFAYYGGLQLSSMALVGGAAMLIHGTARPARPRVARHIRVLPAGPGLQLVGRF